MSNATGGRDRLLHRRSAAIWRLGFTAVALHLCAAFAIAQIEPLAHPTVGQRIESLGMAAGSGYRFVVFGDQKGLWTEDFPALLSQVHELAQESDNPLLFMIDTGDIVDNGTKEDQFEKMRTLLTAVDDLPYLVAAGNHEVQDTDTKARRNVFEFLKNTVGDKDYSPDRLYFKKTIGSARFLFLDSNDLSSIYGDSREVVERRRKQIEWLDQELENEVHPTFVALHHPFVLSADKHKKHAIRLWSHRYPDGRTLPEKLSDGGVDVVFAGHVHTYESFELERNGRKMWFVNVSGWPSTWWFPGKRRARELQDANQHLTEQGFDMRHWQVEQIDFMRRWEEGNQFALIAVDPCGGLEIKVISTKGPILDTITIPSSAFK